MALCDSKKYVASILFNKISEFITEPLAQAVHIIILIVFNAKP